MQLGAALASLQPGLEGLMRGYAEGQRQVDAAQAEADAQQMALRRDIRSWADAVRENPALADRSPYYRQIYETRLARNVVQNRSNEVFAEYWQSDLAGSTDPGAIQGWLRERYSGALDNFRGSPAALAAATEELRNQAQTLVRTHSQQAARNLVQRNEDSFNAAIGAVFDQAAQRGWNAEWMNGELRRLQDEAVAQGLDGRAINRALIAQTEEAMVRHNRPDLARLGDVERPDGTPGFGRTAEGRNAFRRAEDRIMSRQVQASNLAFANIARERAEAERNAHIALADHLYGQLSRGQDPQLSPDLIRQLARVSPDLAGRAHTLFNQSRDFARQDNAPLVAMLELGISRGVADERGLNEAFAARQMSPATYSRLLGQVNAIRNDSTLNDGSVQRIIDEARQLVGDPDQMGGIFRRPEAAAAMGMQLRDALIRFRQENRAATLGQSVEFLQKEVERLVPIYAPGMNLERWRLERVQQEGVPPPGRRQPTAQSPAPGLAARPAERQQQQQQAQTQQPQAVTVEPSPNFDWNRRPAFATRSELDRAYQAWLDNPRDPTNPITRWMIQGQVANPTLFYQRQVGLIPNR